MIVFMNGKEYLCLMLASFYWHMILCFFSLVFLHADLLSTGFDCINVFNCFICTNFLSTFSQGVKSDVRTSSGMFLSSEERKYPIVQVSLIVFFRVDTRKNGQGFNDNYYVFNFLSFT